jgi:hypothetical protein
VNCTWEKGKFLPPIGILIPCCNMFGHLGKNFYKIPKFFCCTASRKIHFCIRNTFCLFCRHSVTFLAAIWRNRTPVIRVAIRTGEARSPGIASVLGTLATWPQDRGQARTERGTPRIRMEAVEVKLEKTSLEESAAGWVEQVQRRTAVQDRQVFT